jgi:hypothetical protein
MLELFDKISGKTGDDVYLLAVDAFRSQPYLPMLLKFYMDNDNNIITEAKILMMMKYYNVEKRWTKINQITEVGEFVMNRMDTIRKKELGWVTGVNYLSVEMNNAKFLIDTYKMLQAEVRHVNQYKIMKNSMMLLNKTDIKWYVRMLCNKLKLPAEVIKAVEEYEKESNGV